METLNDHIYVYYIKDNTLIFDRSVSRYGLGPCRAKELVVKHKSNGYESFFTIGTVTKLGALM